MSAKYKITTFKNRFATEGTQTERTFEELYFGFRNKVKRTREKFSEYVGADKSTQIVIKDVGGFIGGETEGNKRINGIKIKRQLLTLDIDTKVPNVLSYLERNIYFLCIVHSTHRHSPNENRFRIIAPLSREVNADEYEALGRRIAYGIENSPQETFQNLFDETTFQANRLMFFPSVSADGEFVCEILNIDPFKDEQKIIDVDKVLDEYLDKNDIYEWFKPTKINDEQIGKNNVDSKAPLKAKGLVGAFNRTYSITQTIEKFLPDIYVKEKNGRYTYTKGVTHGGGNILNEDTIFYSHHGTDPANLYYRSAFDLVRIHKFGNYDKGFTPEKEIGGYVEKTDSFLQMIEFCRTLPEVLGNSEQNIAMQHRLEKQEEFIKENFDTIEQTVFEIEKQEILEELKTINGETSETSIETSETSIEPVDEKPTFDDKSWIVQLDGIKSDLTKMDVIFKNDKMVGSLFYFDTFRENICFQKKPFWRHQFKVGQALEDKDMAHIRVHLDKVYGIKGEKKIDDAIVVEADKIQVNKVLDFLDNLVWDGKSRIETFFYDFFKVPLNPFTRVAFKKWLVGAVSRIFEAGAPMDLLLVIKGNQGIGKSLFLKRLATFDWSNPSDHLYSDTKIDFDKAKDSYEQLEGVWIYEWKELAGMNMSEQESIKAFVDKTEDKFRRSYGRRNVEIKRRVAFAGTTNEKQPLRDRSGNRRFLVMESPLKRNECYIKDKTIFTEEYKNQLIAEAVFLYKNGFDIFEWTDEEKDWWEKSNEDNLVENDLHGQVGSYLSMKKPAHWYSMSIFDMQQYMDNYDFDNNKPDAFYDATLCQTSKKVCIKEIWQVALRQRDITINRFHRDLVLGALEKAGFKLQKTQGRFGVFGHQLEVKKEDGDFNDYPF